MAQKVGRNMKKSSDFWSYIKQKVREDRKRVRKNTLYEVLDHINLNMGKGIGDEWDAGYESALHEMFIYVSTMIGKVDQGKRG